MNPPQPVPYVAVCGGGEADESERALAKEVGRLLAEAGAVVLCGGLDGVMAAASEGASGAGGTVVGILPGVSREAANPHLSLALPTGLGQARNAVLTTAADAVIAVGRGWGTLSEIGFAKRLGRRVVALGSWPLEGLEVAESPAEAVRLALG